MMYNIDNLEETKAKLDKINNRIKYPVGNTLSYIDIDQLLELSWLFKHNTEDLYCFPVTQELINDCSKMSDEEKLLYYKYNDLKDINYIKDNNFITE